VLDGRGWSSPRPGRFTSGTEPRYPLYRRLGGPMGRSGRVWSRENLLFTSEFEPRTVQAVASRYTGYASLAILYKVENKNGMKMITWFFKTFLMVQSLTRETNREHGALLKCLLSWSKNKLLNTCSRYTEGVQTDNETHSVSYSICAEASSTKLKTAGAWNWPPASMYCWDYKCVEIHLHCPLCFHEKVYSSVQEKFTFAI